MPPRTSAKPVAVDRKRLSDELPVFFAASNVGWYPVRSRDKTPNGPGFAPTVVEAIELEFGDRGVSRGLLPSVKADREIIEAFRAHIAEGTDDRIRLNNLREIAPDRRPPFAKFDTINTPSALCKLIADTGEDVRDCILYEESKGDDARQDVLIALDRLLNDESLEADGDVPQGL